MDRGSETSRAEEMGRHEVGSDLGWRKSNRLVTFRGMGAGFGGEAECISQFSSGDLRDRNVIRCQELLRLKAINNLFYAWPRY